MEGETEIKKLFLSVLAATFLFGGFSSTTIAATKTGWVSSKGHWYFYSKPGSLYKGWLKSENQWYFFDNTGVMRTGWLNTGGKWYYLDGSGAMKTGWLQVGSNLYYLNTNGVMKTGWQQIGFNAYYFNTNGVMAHDTIVDGYPLDHEGVRGVADPNYVKFQNAVDEIMSGAKKQKTTLAKVMYVKNEVEERTVYGWGEHATDPYGPLVEGKAVCEAYAMAVNYLLLRLDIPSKVVWYDDGSIDYSNTHAWNLVQVDGNWYHLDATWDSPNAYQFFLLPDNLIKQYSYHSHWDPLRYQDGDLNWAFYDGWGMNYNIKLQTPSATYNKFSYIREMNNNSDCITTDYQNFYYVNKNDHNSIWELSLDGTINKKLIEGNFDRVIYLNNSLYVLSLQYSNQTHITVSRYSLDGKEMSELKNLYVTGDFTYSFTVKDQSIELSVNDQVYKIN